MESQKVFGDLVAKVDVERAPVTADVSRTVFGFSQNTSSTSASGVRVRWYVSRWRPVTKKTYCNSDEFCVFALKGCSGACRRMFLLTAASESIKIDVVVV